MGIAERFAAIVGSDNVSALEDDRLSQARDLFPGELDPGAALVVAPSDADEVGSVISAAQERQLAVAARGGGMSYTGGFALGGRDAVLMDLRRLDRIRDIKTDDRFVVVEAGTTWESLGNALRQHHLRSALRGPISGNVSTIGGALSQNLPGSMDAVLGLEIVAADGKPFWTGSAAASNRLPFYRNFGPDLTGLFLGDAGTLGIKTAAAIRLEPIPEGAAHASYAFDTMLEAARAMTGVAALGLGGRVFALDPLKNKTSTKVSLSEGLTTLAKVATSGRIGTGLADAARIAAAGRDAFDQVNWSVHLSFEAASQTAAELSLAEAARICGRQGRAIEPSIPVAMRARPFSIRGFLGIKGERWVPLHGIFPLSAVDTVIEAVQRFFDDRNPALASHDVVYSFMMSVSAGHFVIEPMFYWPDALLDTHRQHLSERQLSKLDAYEDNPLARQCVRETRDALRDLFAALGGVATQLGRYYPYRESLAPASRAVFDRLKAALDPHDVLNPGALGTGRKLEE